MKCYEIFCMSDWWWCVKVTNKNMIKIYIMFVFNGMLVDRCQLYCKY
jgi:hypothetical protein